MAANGSNVNAFMEQVHLAYHCASMDERTEKPSVRKRGQSGLLGLHTAGAAVFGAIGSGRGGGGVSLWNLVALGLSVPQLLFSDEPER